MREGRESKKVREGRGPKKGREGRGPKKGRVGRGWAKQEIDQVKCFDCYFRSGNVSVYSFQ